LAHATSKCHTIITVEDGSIIGGLYSLVSEYIASSNLRIKLIGLGAPDRFIEQGTNQELMHEFGYDAEAIYNTLIDTLKTQ
jgi:Deoxyxylulose-5-phosphate synthase